MCSVLDVKTNLCLQVNDTTTLDPTLNKNYYAILDSGASSNFIMDSAVVKEKHTEHEQKRVTLPDGRKIVSSHKCELDLPNLPPEARQGYILPEMQNNSLLSIPSLCETGCQVTFTKDNCIVSYKDKVIMKGVKSKENGLWYVPKLQNRTTIFCNCPATRSSKQCLPHLHQSRSNPVSPSVPVLSDSKHIV